MGGVHSTWNGAPIGSRSLSDLQFKRRKSLAAEKMYREHYNRKNGVEGRHVYGGSGIEIKSLCWHFSFAFLTFSSCMNPI